MHGVHTTSRTRSIPRAPRIPLLGSLPGLLRGQLEFLERAFAQQGRIFELDMGLARAVIVADLAAAEDVLVTKARNFDKGGAFWDGLRNALGLGLAMSEGELWRRQRKLMQPAFNRGQVEGYRDTITGTIEEALDRLDPSGPLDIAQWCDRLLAALTVRILFGSTADTSRTDELRRVMAEMFDMVLMGLVTHKVPRWLPMPGRRRFEVARQTLDALVMALIDERRRAPKAGHDFLSVLLQAADAPSLVVGLELCEDFWVAVPPSAFQTVAGATVVANLSASNFIVGKAELRRLLAQASSDRGKCAYVYVAAGPGESSTDLAFDADAFVAENGRVVASSTRFARHEQLVSVDVDLERLLRERIVTTTFGDCARAHARRFRRIPFVGQDRIVPPLRRSVPRHPFVPQDPQTLDARCWEIFEIQTNALATRMRAVGRPRLVLGVSGGLDSTQAALVAATALDLQGQPRADLLCVTMPGLGTTAGTRGNAERLAEALGAQLRVVSISEASRMVLQLLGHRAVEADDDNDTERICAGDCDDDDPCTVDTCDALGACDHAAFDGPCEDGDLCTVGEECAAGTCAGGEPADCDDANPCTAD
ncbi:MAG: cytochrome P450, partial [Myxococcales bacterium]|nr:cytochrome P450 [Myxococcales bacterium]